MYSKISFFSFLALFYFHNSPFPSSLPPPSLISLFLSFAFKYKKWCSSILFLNFLYLPPLKSSLLLYLLLHSFLFTLPHPSLPSPHLTYRLFYSFTFICLPSNSLPRSLLSPLLTSFSSPTLLFFYLLFSFPFLFALLLYKLISSFTFLYLSSISVPYSFLTPFPSSSSSLMLLFLYLLSPFLTFFTLLTLHFPLFTFTLLYSSFSLFPFLNVTSLPFLTL